MRSLAGVKGSESIFVVVSVAFVVEVEGSSESMSSRGKFLLGRRPPFRA